MSDTPNATPDCFEPVARPTLPGLALGIALSLSPAIVVAKQTAPMKLVTGDNYAPFSDQNLPGGGLATHLVTYLFEHQPFGHCPFR